MTLTFFHFLFTIAWYKMLEVAGTFSMPPPGAMPAFEKFKVAGAVFSSIGFMNLSLNVNSVGFYQCTKLTIVPVTLAINSFAYAVYTTCKVKVALSILLAGVGVATVSEVHLRPLGLAYGILAGTHRCVSNPGLALWLPCSLDVPSEPSCGCQSCARPCARSGRARSKKSLGCLRPSFKPFSRRGCRPRLSPLPY